MSSVVLSCPSLAVRRKTYIPGVENEAAELAAFASVNVTAAGPLTAVQFADKLLPYGKPSSVIVPFSLTAELPTGRRLIESKKASLVTPLLRVASKRTRIHPV